MGLARVKRVRLLADSLAFSVMIAVLGQPLVLADESSSGADSGSSSSSSSSSSPSSSSTPLFGDSGSSSSSAPSAGGSSAGAASAPAGGGGGEMVKVYDKDMTPVNPLQGLFQMQPQYPTPGTTQMFPEAVSPNMGKDGSVQGRNPGQSSHTFQQGFNDPNAPKGEDNSSKVNAIQGLFQMQPQYPTPGTTQMFPEAVSKNSGNDSEVQGRNPGQASTIHQQSFKDPYAAPVENSKDQTNYLNSLFQQQPQYVSPNKTIEFPNAVQKNLGEDTQQSGRHPGQDGTAFGATHSHSGTATINPGLPLDPEAGPQTATAQGYRKNLEEKGLFDDKVERLLDEKGLLKESEPKLMTKEEKEALDKKEKEEKKEEAAAEKKEESAEKKEEEKKEGEKKEGEKKEEKEGEKKDEKDEKKDEEKKDAEKKDGDKKDGDKKESDKKAADKKDGDKKDGDKKDGDKKDGDKKDGDKKDGDKKEEVIYAPYNPLREAISLMNSNRLQESIDLLSREIKKTAINPQAFYTRAVVYVRMRKYPEASADYNQVLKLAPSGPMATLAKTGLSKLKF